MTKIILLDKTKHQFSEINFHSVLNLVFYDQAGIFDQIWTNISFEKRP